MTFLQQLKAGVPVVVRQGVNVALPVTELRTMPVPGVDGAKIHTCFVRVTDLPSSFDEFMSINPRVPSRNKVGLLSGPVAKGILQTLQEHPEEMVLKNQGIYVLVDSVAWAQRRLMLRMTDKGKHGIVNGGHTYAAIREAIDTCSSQEELDALSNAYVKLNIYTGISAEFVPEIAEGLNRSKQVDNPSLVNLQGEFDIIRKVMHGKPGADSIAYFQGDNGSTYITEVLVALELFNVRRFSESKHPNSLYNRQALGLQYFMEDWQQDGAYMQQLVSLLPDILSLGDKIRASTPLVATKNRFKFGRIKISANERAGTERKTKVKLPFIEAESGYRVPNGWVLPMLAAFRANLAYDNGFKWKLPIDSLLQTVLPELVQVCVTEHRENNARPEMIGKRESAYAQCYAKVQLALAKQGKLF